MGWTYNTKSQRVEETLAGRFISRAEALRFAWQINKQNAKLYTEQEHVFRRQLVEELMPEGYTEGTTRHNDLKIVCKYNQRFATMPIEWMAIHLPELDSATFAALKQVVRLKPELDTKKYKNLTQEEKQLVDEYLVGNWALPQVSIMEEEDGF